MIETPANHVAGSAPLASLPGREHEAAAHHAAPPALQGARASHQDDDDAPPASEGPPRWPRVFPGL